MFHYFNGKLQVIWNKKLLTNDFFGIEVQYSWKQGLSASGGEYFLFPYLDDNRKSVFYFAFDSMEQKNMFEDMLKISWVWPKTAFQLAQLPRENLQNAIKTFDAKFFQSIPWIGPKSAKKILLEMKWNFEFDDIQRMDVDQRLYKDIIKSLRGFGYDAERIKTTLQRYEGKISKENMSEVIKWIISQM